jgi:hypothetical protein
MRVARHLYRCGADHAMSPRSVTPWHWLHTRAEDWSMVSGRPALLAGTNADWSRLSEIWNNLGSAIGRYHGGSNFNRVAQRFVATKPRPCAVRPASSAVPHHVFRAGARPSCGLVRRNRCGHDQKCHCGIGKNFLCSRCLLPGVYSLTRSQSLRPELPSGQYYNER